MCIITISRGTLSGGQAVADQLAERLGYPVLSREQLLLEAANEHGVSEEDLADSLDKPPRFWQQMAGQRLAYVKCVTAVLIEHAGSGRLIYQGNVGHLLLAGIGHVLRVRVIAPMTQRIEAVMEQNGLDHDQAVAHIYRVDKRRTKWARALYGVDWRDPAQYDVIVNLEHISVDRACATIADLSASDDFQPTAASRQSLANLNLSCRVWAALARNPNTRNAGLDVVADGGEVTITGSVGTSKTIDAITRTAEQVDGVKAVHCECGMGADWCW